MHGSKKPVEHQLMESCEFVRGAWAFGFQVSHVCLPVGVGLPWKPFHFEIGMTLINVRWIKNSCAFSMDQKPSPSMMKATHGEIRIS